MPRSVYYQSPGNPIQLAKVPSAPLELEFAYHRGVDNDDLEYTRQVIKELILASFAGLLVFWFSAVFFGSATMGLLLLGLLAVIAWWVMATQLNVTQSVVLTAIIAAWIYYWVPLPRAFEVFVALAATTYLAREVVRHFTFLSTVAPIPLQTAWSIRKAVCWQTIASSLVLLPFAIGAVIPGAMPMMLLVGGFAWLILVLLYVNRPAEYADNFWDAIGSWCSYNRSEEPIAGILVSPAGPAKQRLRLLVGVVLLNACVIFKIVFLPLLGGMQVGQLAGPAGVMTFLVQLLIAVIVSGLAAVVPLSVVMMVICVIGTPVFGRLSIPKPSFVSAEEWKEITDRIRQSNNEVEQNSIYQGRVSFDQSPMLVPTEVFKEHAHLLGDSGSGKTARGLSPFIEHVLGTGIASVMILDLIGDSQELLQTIRCGADTAKELAGVEIPIRYFSLRDDQATYGFNPFRLDCWNQLNSLQKTDILCGGLGLIYGTEYGEGYYSSANAAVLYATVVISRRYQVSRNWLRRSAM